MHFWQRKKIGEKLLFSCNQTPLSDAGESNSPLLCSSAVCSYQGLSLPKSCNRGNRDAHSGKCLCYHVSLNIQALNCYFFRITRIIYSPFNALSIFSTQYDLSSLRTLNLITDIFVKIRANWDFSSQVLGDAGVTDCFHIVLIVVW